MIKKLILLVVILTGLAGIWYWINFNKTTTDSAPEEQPIEVKINPMSIESLKLRDYPGSEIKIEETLSSGSNYHRYIGSYLSEGYKIYGLLTIPKTDKPPKGYPIIVFLHGYIPPKEYKTTERYLAYQDGLAKNGFITFKIDMRGHGNSEGQALGSHYSETYVVDTLNAIASMKKLAQASPEKIGVWGHSNGGEIGLRTITISSEVKVGVFWAGVVGSFKGMLEDYNHKIAFLNINRDPPEIILENGLPSENPAFWDKIDPYNYLDDIDVAIQLHHGTADESVPIETSQELATALKDRAKIAQLYLYQKGDHNLSNPAFNQAMERTVSFFKKYLSQDD